MLALELKGIEFETVTLPTGCIPSSPASRGFPGNPDADQEASTGQTRGGLAMMDRMGTVPALRHGGPADPDQPRDRRLPRGAAARPSRSTRPTPQRRAAVEDAFDWGDQTLQMAARRTVMAAAGTSLDALHERGARGRLGPLLARNDTAAWH